MLERLIKYFKPHSPQQINTSPTLSAAVQQAISQLPNEVKFLNLVEIGSRDGNDANLLKQLLGVPDENVHVIEANPDCYQNIKKSYPLFNCYPLAIYESKGKLSFNKVNKDNIGTSSILDRNDSYYQGRSKKILVDTLRGEEWLEQNQISEISFCKIDVEGATLQVLQSFGEKLSCIKLIHLECEHQPIWHHQALYQEVATYLTSKGFRQIHFEYVSQAQLQSDSIWYYDNNPNKSQVNEN